MNNFPKNNKMLPYILKSFKDWCDDNFLDIHINIVITDECMLPNHIKNNMKELVLNISDSAARDIQFDPQYLLFTTKFNGMPSNVAIPYENIKGAFVQTTKFGFNFTEHFTQLLKPAEKTTQSIPPGSSGYSLGVEGSKEEPNNRENKVVEFKKRPKLTLIPGGKKD